MSPLLLENLKHALIGWSYVAIPLIIVHFVLTLAFNHRRKQSQENRDGTQ